MELKSSLGLNQVIEDIKKGQLVPVYLIWGDEKYLVHEAVQRITEIILPDKEKLLSLETFEGGEEDWEKIVMSLRTYSFFGSRRVILVKDTQIFESKIKVEEIFGRSMEEFERGRLDEAVRFFRMALGYLKFDEIDDQVFKQLESLPEASINLDNEEWKKKIGEACRNQGLVPIPYEDNSDKLDLALKERKEGKGIPENNVLILSASSIDRRKRLFKTINEVGIIIDFSVQKKWDRAEEEEKKTLRQKATELLRGSGKTIGKDAFDALVNKTGADIGMFLNELEKLITSVKDRKTIEPDDVEEIVGRTKEDSKFDLQKAVGQRNLERAMFFLMELSAQGEFHLSLLQSIATEIRHLIAAKELIESKLKARWNSQMNLEAFKRSIYFPIILKMKKEEDSGQKKSPYNILKLPADALWELFKNSQSFSREELFRAIKLLAETDSRTKFSRVSPIHLLEKVLFEICGPGVTASANKRASN